MKSFRAVRNPPYHSGCTGHPRYKRSSPSFLPLKRTVLLLMTAFGLTMSAHAINFTDTKKSKSVVDYFLELPEAEFDDEVHDALGNPKDDAAAGYRIIPDDASAIEILGLIKKGKGIIDLENGYIYYGKGVINSTHEARKGYTFYNGDIQAALFPGKPTVLAIVKANHDLTLFVEQYDAWRGEGYQYRMVSANRGLLPVTNGANVRFVLPRYGTVITVTKADGTPVSYWAWNGFRFTSTPGK
jgi:hypothetical protein